MTPDQLSKMTPEEKRAAVAMATGWRDIRLCSCKVKNRGLSPKGKDGHLPDFLNDLNAMHAAVASLSYERRNAYSATLTGIVFEGDALGWQDWRDTWAISEATAAQRAEAFLMAVG